MFPDKNCAFCTNVANHKRAIVRKELAWAFPTNIPIVPGHTLVVPTRCVATFGELTEGEKEALFGLIEEITKALTKVFGAEGFNFAWNQGEMAGQSVPHIHVHVLPRKTGDTGITEYEPRNFLYRPGSREDTPEKELQAVAALIRGAL